MTHNRIVLPHFETKHQEHAMKNVKEFFDSFHLANGWDSESSA